MYLRALLQRLPKLQQPHSPDVDEPISFSPSWKKSQVFDEARSN
jgi:hypothetical protein